MTSESPAKSTVEEAGQSTKPTPKHIFEGHEDSVWCIVFLHDNVHVVSGSYDGTMRKWNCDTGLLVGEPWKGEGGRVYALALSPDGNTIACGRADGSVQRWNTGGEMIEGVWTGHNNWVRSLSWSPSGRHLASGCEDGTILIRKAESGEVEVGSIKTGQGDVRSLAYSPSGDRITSGGHNHTICIWDSKTGELVVGPIEDLGLCVTSLVWSSDGTKIYSASDKIARVFDSVSGKLLHRFNHPSFLYSVALSPKGNVLACVGSDGIGQLWDTETHQQISQPCGASHERFFCVLFSQDGRYLAYGGDHKNITLWIANEMAPEVAVGASRTIKDAVPEEEDTRSASTSSSYLDRDAKNPRARPGDHEGEGSVDPYNNFFRSSKTSLALASSDSDPRPLHRRLWTFVTRSRYRPSENKPAPQNERHKRSLFPRRAQAPKNKMDKEERDNQYDDLSQHLYPPPALRLWDIFIPSRRRAPGHESIPLRQHAKRSFFSQHSGPRPVTIYAARPKKLWWIAPRPVLVEAQSVDKENGNTGESPSAAPQPSSAAQPHSTAQSEQQAQAPHATHPTGSQYEEYDYGFWGNFWLALGCISRHPRRIIAVTVPPAAGS